MVSMRFIDNKAHNLFFLGMPTDFFFPFTALGNAAMDARRSWTTKQDDNEEEFPSVSQVGVYLCTKEI